MNFQVRNSITVRIITIAFLVLVLLIPTAMISDLIREREYTRDEAITEVSKKWGDPQSLVGPVLTVPYKIYRNMGKPTEEIIIENAHFLPAELKISGNLQPQKRRRGIYEVVVFESELILTGKFNKANFAEWNINPAHILWNDAAVNLGIPDMRGIQEQVSVLWNSEVLNFNPGLSNNNLMASGISTKIKATSEINEYTFEIKLKLNGSKYLYFYPLGEVTQITLSSPWSNPKFNGAFLPDKHSVTEKGFEANWKVLHLNRNYPQQWCGTAFDISASQFGVDLLLPVDEYRKSDRAVKYSIMFLALTFLTFFFIEILNKKRIHPVQYILVGFALVLFFSLLLALSEHISFDWAYLIATIATISLIVGYSTVVFKKARLSLLLAGILIILYGFIYTTLQLQDYALLLGSVGLFIVLGFVMYVSRKIDWYGFSEQEIIEV